MIKKTYEKILGIPDIFISKFFGQSGFIHCNSIVNCYKNDNSRCIKTELIRCLVHFFGSAVFLLFISYLKISAQINLSIIFILFIIYQELFIHNKYYSQPKWKGVADILSWVLPIIIYFYFVLK